MASTTQRTSHSFLVAPRSLLPFGRGAFPLGGSLVVAIVILALLVVILVQLVKLRAEVGDVAGALPVPDPLPGLQFVEPGPCDCGGRDAGDYEPGDAYGPCDGDAQ